MTNTNINTSQAMSLHLDRLLNTIAQEITPSADDLFERMKIYRNFQRTCLSMLHLIFGERCKNYRFIFHLAGSTVTPFFLKNQSDIDVVIEVRSKSDPLPNASVIIAMLRDKFEQKSTYPYVQAYPYAAVPVLQLKNEQGFAIDVTICNSSPSTTKSAMQFYTTKLKHYGSFPLVRSLILLFKNFIAQRGQYDDSIL
jgi:DNA polymerase sigma